jgi:hypothetical protein
MNKAEAEAKAEAAVPVRFSFYAFRNHSHRMRAYAIWMRKEQLFARPSLCEAVGWAEEPCARGKTCRCHNPCVADLPASTQCVRRVGSGTITVTDARARTPPTAQVVCVFLCMCVCCVYVCVLIHRTSVAVSMPAESWSPLPP